MEPVLAVNVLLLQTRISLSDRRRMVWQVILHKNWYLSPEYLQLNLGWMSCKPLHQYKIQRAIYWLSYTVIPSGVARGAGAYLQRSPGQRQGSPWTGHSREHKMQFLHSLKRLNYYWNWKFHIFCVKDQSFLHSHYHYNWLRGLARSLD